MKRNVTPLRLQPAHLREQTLDLLAVQLGGRLVENNEPRAIGQRPRDLDQLPSLDLEVAGARPFRDRDIPAIEHLAGVSPERAPGDESTLKRLPVDEQIFRNRQVRNDGRMLVDAGDPLAPSFTVGDRRRRLPMEANLSAVRLTKAGQDSDERRLAGAVAPDEPMGLAGKYPQARFAKRNRRAVALRDADRFHDRNRIGPAALGRGFKRRRLDHQGRCYLLLPQNALSSTFSLVTKGADS